MNGKKFLKSGSKPTLNLGKQDQDNVQTNISNTDDSIISDPLNTTFTTEELSGTYPKNEILQHSHKVETFSRQSNTIPVNERALQSNIGTLAVLNK